ncbi:MAG: [FeFe] hydrogenase H-cluster radical SAM maturase HydE [Blautia sp.]|nr:[FeFe] hydrogenase H-cluster radical SAM maturase HydE [Blautia sp.]MDD7728629.1 [FeFe] hydrogenase H-cluster radical SAM maturase HydE [Clostridia bacterium]MDY5663059.1 [FeFe] hydrogenase H-cluster radical SAM maturase HydE [Blautia sp.]
MNRDIIALIDKLEDQHSLSLEEYAILVQGRTPEAMEYIGEKARRIRREIYGTSVYVRGLIEFTNLCRNNCLYCGIRRSNHHCDRYRLTKDEILECCAAGYELGFRTFVLQGGEDAYWNDEILCGLIRQIKERYQDCALTLSIGERSRESYQKLYDAGADRYLLRHETADKTHYEKLHPAEMSFDNRMKCLMELKEIGYQVGCGFMVGSPWQTPETLAEDLKFIEEFSPDMCGIGPFIPHKDTPLGNHDAGTLEETLWLLSIIRLMLPHVLLPATTALGTIHPKGREMGILAGANVVMPNLSPVSVRKKYELYDNKICTGDEAAECRACLARRMQSVGYELVTDRGDVKRKRNF